LGTDKYGHFRTRVYWRSPSYFVAAPAARRALPPVASGEQIKRYFPDMLELLGVEKRFHALPRRRRMRQPGEREHIQTERTDEHALTRIS
jgi:hypothetical protein